MTMRPEPEDYSPDLLKDALDAVRADDDATEVPARMQQVVMREWDARSAERKRRSMTAAWCGAIAASIIAAVVLSRPNDTPIRFEAVGSEMHFTEVVLDDDRASMQYVQVRVPQSALAGLGLPIADPAEDQSVIVEVLVGLDGVPHVVRLLPREMP